MGSAARKKPRKMHLNVLITQLFGGIQMDYGTFADQVVDLVGGPQNVNGLEHCVTRLRFVLKDESKADTPAIEKLDGVLSVVKAAGQYQVVVGGEVVPCFNEIMKRYDFSEDGAAEKKPVEKPHDAMGWVKYLWNALIGYLSGTMIPIIPLFIGCGLINCIMSVAQLYGGLDAESSTYAVLKATCNAPFYFLPVLVGFTAAKKLKCNQMLGAMCGLVLLHPVFTALVGSQTPTDFFGMPFSALNYSSTVFPVLIGVWVLSKIEGPIYNVLPKVLKSIFGPFLCIAIMSPLMFFVLGPLGYYVGATLANALLSLQNLPLGLGCAILSGLQPVLVLFGAHTVLAPFMIANIEAGFDALIRPAFIAAAFGGVGALLAVLLKAKNSNLKGLAASCSVMQLLGTAEPGMYGIMIPLARPFAATLIGAFFGGMTSSMLGARAYAMGKNGIFGWLVFQDTMPQIIIASAVALVVAFVVAWVLGFDETRFEK